MFVLPRFAAFQRPLLALAATFSFCAAPLISTANAAPDQPVASAAPATFPALRTVSAGNLVELNKVLQSGAALGAVDTYGRTPLMIAAALGRADLVHVLIIKGSDLTQRDKTGRTALDYSRAAGNLPLFKSRNTIFAQANKVQRAGEKTLSAIDKMQGGKRVLLYFLPGGDKAQKTAHTLLKNRDSWCDALGAALLARNEEPAVLVASILDLPQADDVKQGRQLVALLASARAGDPKSLKRLWPAFDGTGMSNEDTEKWKMFLRVIDRGKIKDAERLTIDPDYKPFVENALDLFTQAAVLLPGSVDDQMQVERLLTPPSRPNSAEPTLLPVAP